MATNFQAAETSLRACASRNLASILLPSLCLGVEGVEAPAMLILCMVSEKLMVECSISGYGTKHCYNGVFSFGLSM